MTVGYELEKITGLRLFHNHMTIDLVLRFFPFGTPAFNRLVREFRMRIFEEVAASDLPGLIFTYVWALDDPQDKAFIDEICDIFRSKGARVYFVELFASLEKDCGATKRSFALPKSARNETSKPPGALCWRLKARKSSTQTATSSIRSVIFTSTTPICRPTRSHVASPRGWIRSGSREDDIAASGTSDRRISTVNEL